LPKPLLDGADLKLGLFSANCSSGLAVTMRLLGMQAQSFTPEMLQVFRGRFAGGHGACPLIGSPDEVAAEIKRFHDAGFGGMTLSFVDYVGELETFAQEVIPRLERLGVRNPR
jgi:alkanesulfonate monooxygenase SsuD/methylene tetrahydromethanopterin reductase-like flavin-dependent oxidoreductase (luciferase family)